MGLKPLCFCSVLCLIVWATGCGGGQTSPLVGNVSATANPQVAVYSVSTSAPGDVSVQFGLDTTYGLTTSTQPSTQGG